MGKREVGREKKIKKPLKPLHVQVNDVSYVQVCNSISQICPKLFFYSPYFSLLQLTYIPLLGSALYQLIQDLMLLD